MANIKIMAKSVSSLFKSGSAPQKVIDQIVQEDQNDLTSLAQGENMIDSISFKKGTGKKDRAVYLVGTKTIPAAVITRLLPSLDGLSGPKLDRSFYQGLEKYPEALDVLDGLAITPAAAVAKLKALQAEAKPIREKSGQRVSKAVKTAELFSKGICKRFKGTPEEMVSSFIELVAKPEFKAEAIDCIAAYERNHGKTTLGYVKTSNRKGNPEAQKGLAKARALKSKK